MSQVVKPSERSRLKSRQRVFVFGNTCEEDAAVSAHARLMGGMMCVAAVLALATPAQAQRHGFGGGAPAARAAPHFAAPAAVPHVAAPHFSAPRAAAAPHFAPRAAPHFAAQNVAPASHFAGRRFAAPRMAARPAMGRAHAPHFAGRHVAAPHLARSGRFVHAGSRHFAGAHSRAAASIRSDGRRSHVATGRIAPRTSRQALQSRRTGSTPSVRTAAQGRRPTGTVGRAATHTPTTVGANLRGRHATAAQPVLRNAVLASRSSRGGRTPGLANSLANSTFRGAFAQSRFAQDWRRHHHHHHFGVVLGFVGPLFWPYAYDDFVDYTYWPYAYDTFWPYAFDDAYLGIYGGYAPEYYAPEQTYAYAGAPATGYADAARTARTASTTATGRASASHLRICSGQPADLVNFP